MKIVIDSSVLEKRGFTMQDFSIILYYFSGGSGVLNEKLCLELWENGFLKKIPDGFQFHEGKKTKLKAWMLESSNDQDQVTRLTNLAKAMQNEYPEGKKGNKYYWRDSTKIIAARLAVFIKKYGDHEDEEFINATKNYVKSYNGDYTYMELLKYFIYKKKKESGEETSSLASYLENASEVSLQDRDWTTNIV